MHKMKSTDARWLIALLVTAVTLLMYGVVTGEDASGWVIFPLTLVAMWCGVKLQPYVDRAHDPEVDDVDDD